MLKSDLIIKVADLERSNRWYRYELPRQRAIKDATIQHALDSLAENNRELDAGWSIAAMAFAVGCFIGMLGGMLTYAFYLYDRGF